MHIQIYTYFSVRIVSGMYTQTNMHACMHIIYPTLTFDLNCITHIRAHAYVHTRTYVHHPHIHPPTHTHTTVRAAGNQQFSPTQLGKSLVTGYERLGIELARPQFRSRMEEDMKDIALGRQQKHQVVTTWMGIMTPVLKACVEKSRQLVAEMHHFFQVCSYLLIHVYMHMYTGS